jgi:hypothetical protein
MYKTLIYNSNETKIILKKQTNINTTRLPGNQLEDVLKFREYERGKQ